MNTLLIRKDAKQGWKSAAKQSMKDSLESLRNWASAMNEQLGWAKYSVEEPTA